MSHIEVIFHETHKTDAVQRFTLEKAKEACCFHQSFPEYELTPLVDLKGLAEHLGIENIWIKDESYRFGLNAFKVLGGSYCIGKYIAKQLEMDLKELSYEKMISKEIREKLGDITFVTATDGNHGRGIAWTADRLQQKSVVYMPKGSSKERLENIRNLGADASITDMNYDDAVRYARKKEEENGWVLVQDTTLSEYIKIPEWIMQGYTTMGYEILQQLQGYKPTHIFLQAGVGAMAGAMAGFFSHVYQGDDCPKMIVVEPEEADCIFRTAQALDGTLHTVTGDMNTIMAGLACGEPCSIGWEILEQAADCFVSVPDEIAARGMRILGNPVGNDRKIISGESGAAAFGLAASLLMDDRLKDVKERLSLTKDSKILCISTEGDTDREHYRKIVWDGWYPN